MKLFLPILSAALLISLGGETTQAQNTFADFEAEGVTQGFVVAVKNATGYRQRQYFITLSIAKNGAISGRAVRYHFEPKSPSASPSDGERLTVKAGPSKLGQPIVAYKTYFPWTASAVDAMRCPFYVELSDGAIIRGIVKINGIHKPKIEGTIEAPFGPVSFMGSVLSLHDL